MKTKRQVITAALEELRIIGAAETPAAEDFDLAQRRYDSLLTSLRDDGMAYWSNTNADTAEIPDVAEHGMMLLLAGRLARAFGVDEPAERGEDGQPVVLSVAGLRLLRRHMAKRASGETTAFDLF